jgi:hypothetical protein
MDELQCSSLYGIQVATYWFEQDSLNTFINIYVNHMAFYISPALKATIWMLMKRIASEELNTFNNCSKLPKKLKSYRSN